MQNIKNTKGFEWESNACCKSLVIQSMFSSRLLRYCKLVPMVFEC